jgi:hypothetical protein
VHWSSRTEEHVWNGLTDGHIEHDGLCDVCGCAWPCPSVPLAPYDADEPSYRAYGQVRAVAQPAVYGYARSLQRGRARLCQWQTELRYFCQQAGLRLVHCFCSMGRHPIGERGFSLVRPYIAEAYGADPARSITLATAQPALALRVLLAILEQRPAYGVVVPSIFHLATERQAALALIRQIERLGTRVMVVPANRTAGVVVADAGRALRDPPIDKDRPRPEWIPQGGRA